MQPSVHFNATAPVFPAPPFKDERTEHSPLVLNLFPATFSSETVTCLCGPWSDPDGADSIREAYPGALTWRDRDDGRALYLWHPEESLPGKPLGFNEVTVALEESPQFFQRLLTDGVERGLTGLGFTRKGSGFVNYS